jgi:hydroxyacylglutathione hydrolase
MDITPLSLGFVKVFLIKGKILVDTGLPGNSEKILAALKGQNVDPKQIRLIILTHAHSDHMGSLLEMKKATGAQILIQEKDAKYLEEGKSQRILPVTTKGKILAMLPLGKKTFPKIKADLTYKEEYSLRPYGINGKVIHTPGHTEGSSSIILDSGECIVGDLIMGGFIFQKIPGYPMFATDLSEVKKSIKKIIQLNPSIIHTSHGGPFTAQDLKRKFIP